VRSRRHNQLLCTTVEKLATVVEFIAVADQKLRRFSVQKHSGTRGPFNLDASPGTRGLPGNWIQLELESCICSRLQSHFADLRSVAIVVYGYRVFPWSNANGSTTIAKWRSIHKNRCLRWVYVDSYFAIFRQGCYRKEQKPGSDDDGAARFVIH
jgi:hypothetical protein